MDYKEAGVDIEAAERLTKAFGAGRAFASRIPRTNYWISTDGIGSKAMMGYENDITEGLGQDLVAMVGNDLAVHGVKMTAFLDYLALSDVVAQTDLAIDLVRGVRIACEAVGAELLGGETAEMTGLFDGDLFDIAGFGFGVDVYSVRQKVGPAQKLIALPSSGPHSNGYTAILRALETVGPQDHDYWLERLMEPTCLYWPEIDRLLDDTRFSPSGIAHITGGGPVRNIGRILEPGVDAIISADVPPVFRWLQDVLDMSRREMWNTFNMGMGAVMAVSMDTATPLGMVEVGYTRRGAGGVRIV